MLTTAGRPGRNIAILFSSLKMGAMVSGPLVLVVDDEVDSREILATLLSVAGYQVDVLASGHRVVERAALLEPAAILLDVVMPGLDGLEVARRLKADERTSRIPVIAYSGRAKE